MSTVEQLQIELERLKTENALLKTHAPYGILTRAGFEIEKRTLTNAQYVVFGDIDRMHELNAAHGYETVNQMIRSALRLRSDDLLLTGLWFSGDEIVFVIQSDPEGFCERVRSSFVKQGMTITLAFEQIQHGDELNEAISKAARKVQEAKAG